MAFAILGLGSLVACIPRAAETTKPTAESPAPTSPSPRSPAPLAPSAARDEGDAGDFERLLAEIGRQEQRVRDPNRLFGAYPQAKPKGFRGIPYSRPGPFPGTPFATAAGFSFNFAGDLVPEGCDVLAPDGTLCPGVNAPGVTLDKAQASRLVAMIRAAGVAPDASVQADRPVLHCYDPHLAFVFFDEARAPVGELDVCLDCNGWWATPYVPGLFGALRPDEWTSIVSLCEELGIDGCWRGDPRFEAAVAAQESMPALPARAEVDDLGSSVDLDGAIGATSAFERRALCAHSVRALGVDPRYGANIQGRDGRWWKVLTYQTCVSKFPSCGARVRDVLACERSLTRPTVSPDGPSRESMCAGMDDCLWTLRAERGPT